MTPEQHIKKTIIAQVSDQDPDLDLPKITKGNVDKIYQEGLDNNDDFYDTKSEIREGTIQTGIDPAEYSRHYEVDEVATEIDGVWVGWSYWDGGGKHAKPEAMDWMSDAYFLDVTEEEKMMTVRTFKRK